MRKVFSNFVAAFLIIACLPAFAVERVVPNSNEEVLLSFSPLVKKAAPAVVNIYTKKKVTVKRSLSPFLNDPIFKHFFGNSVPGGRATERIESSLGSGVIVKDNGLIVTNYHVISGSTDIRVVLHDRREFEAKIVLQDQRTDLALLKIDVDDEKIPTLELMDSDDLEVGDMVMAIGNPFGIGQTVTNGIVSAVARTTVNVSDYQFFIQTDAAINPGNSGGALINMEGKLAGLNSAIFTKSGGYDGMGFAIPSNMVATVIRGEGKPIVRPWLGVSVQAVTQEIANSIGMEIPSGGILSAMHPKSPAASAGLKVGDVVMAVGKHEILDEHSLHFRVATYEIGNTVDFKVIRSGKEKVVKVKMTAPPEEPKRDLRVIKNQSALKGATIGNLSPALADELGLNVMSEGVIITNLERGIASRLGVRKNDIVKQVNGINVEDSKHLEKLMNKKEQSWKITVQRGNRLLNIIWNVR